MGAFLKARIGVVALGIVLGLAVVFGNIRFLDTDTWQIVNRTVPPHIKNGHFFLNQTVRNVKFDKEILDGRDFILSMRVMLTPESAFEVKFIQGTNSLSVTLDDKEDKYRAKKWYTIRAEFTNGQLRIFLDDELQSEQIFARTWPMELWLNKELTPSYMDDFSIMEPGGYSLFSDNFGYNVFGTFRVLGCMIAGILLALILSAIETTLFPSILRAYTPKALRNSFFGGWLALPIFFVIFGMYVHVMNLGFLLIVVMVLRILQAKNPSAGDLDLSTAAKWIYFAAVVIFLIIGSDLMARYFDALQNAKEASVTLGYLCAGAMVLYGLCLLYLAVYFLVRADSGNTLALLAWAATPFAFARIMIGFFIKPFGKPSVIFIQEQGIGLFCATVLGIAGFYLLQMVIFNRKKILFSGLVSLLLLVFIGTTAELGVRISPIKDRLKPLSTGKTFNDSDALFFIPEGFFLSPDQQTEGSAFILDSLNFRSGPTTHKKPPGTYRIMVMGGSNVWGDGVEDPRQTFSELLEDILSEHYTARRFEVINAGMQGYISMQLLILMRMYGVAYQPDMLILYINRNDSATQYGPYTLRELWKMRNNLPSVDSFTEEVKIEPRGAERARIALRKSRLYNALVLQITGARASSMEKVSKKLKLVKEVNPIEDIRKNLEEFITLCRENNILLILADEYEYWPVTPTLEDRSIQVRRAMKNIAEENNVPYIPVREILTQRFPEGSIVFSTDIVHLNHRGHRLVAEIMSDFIEKNALIQ